MASDNDVHDLSKKDEVTKVGKFIRKTSIDELPQLWDIFRGVLSFVGPRPERPQFVEKFKEEIPRYMIKHQVRPGLTGWAQVNGRKGVEWNRRIELNVWYVDNMSLLLDIKIIFMTVFKVLKNEDNENTEATVKTEETVNN